MNELIKIKDMTGRYDVTARTLRYYEDMGLIASTRSEDYAYRLYDEAAVKRLEQVLILRRLNISIKDIQRVFNAPGSEVVLEVLDRKISAIDEEVALLHELKEIVQAFIRQIKSVDFRNDGDVKLLYEKARDIESFLDITKKLEEKPEVIRKKPTFSIGFGGYGSDEATREAFALYEEAFGAVKTWEDQPYGSGPGNLHIGMEINGFDFLLKTQGEDRPIGGISCNMHFGSEDDWRRAYDVLTREGSDYSTQSWPHAPVSGVVTDKFGVGWWLHT